VRGPSNLSPIRTRKRGHKLTAEGLNHVTVNDPVLDHIGIAGQTTHFALLPHPAGDKYGSR
jgi:hypothetical protein